MDKNQMKEYDTSLEPMVIINDVEDEDSFQNGDEPERDPLAIDSENEDLLKSVGPDVSIIPIKKKKPTIKIRLFQKEFSKPKNQKPVEQVKQKSPRQPVRHVSEDEAKKVSETYPHRKSLPLEKCPICMKFFRRMKTHLMKHEGVVRDPDDPLTCQMCKKAFNSQSNLQIHMRTHTGDRPYICTVCQKGFSQSCNLVNHMRVHTGEKPFKCPHCDRAFTQSGNLNNHIRLHTDEKPFKCHFCDKAFVQSGNLNSHIRNNHKFAFEYTSVPDHLQ